MLEHSLSVCTPSAAAHALSHSSKCWRHVLPAAVHAAPLMRALLCSRCACGSSHFRQRVHLRHSSDSAQRNSCVVKSSDAAAPHTSVLLKEILEAFSRHHLGVYVDCTLGAGGHTLGVLQQHPEVHTVVGIDLDPTAHAIAGERIQQLLQQRQQGAVPPAPEAPAGPLPTIHQLHGNYSQVVSLLGGVPGGGLVGQVDAMVMDLGVSSMQLDTAGRGFSLMADGPLDMRLDPAGPGRSASDLVNGASEAELGALLREYGEEKAWRAVAGRIVRAREAAPITTTRQLVEVVGRTQLKGSSSSRKGGGKGIHPATRTFQALRIAVNDEINQLERALPDALSCLAPGGLLAVISFHSLEDRLVKHAFLRGEGRPTPAEEALTYGPDAWRHLEALEATAVGRRLTRKPLLPGPEEVAANPRSRSAKLRIFQKAGGSSSGGEQQQWRGSRKRQRAASGSQE